MKANTIHLSPLRLARLPQAGFSLVEVVLAVGIMALGVVTILGLLPHGLEMSRRTANEQAQTRIVDQIVGELQASDWKKMNGLITLGEIFYQFDDQGLTTTTDNLTSYVARAKLSEANEASDGMLVPSNVSQMRNKNLRRVQIDVAAAQTTDFNFDDPPAAAPVKKFTALVAKMRP